MNVHERMKTDGTIVNNLGVKNAEIKERFSENIKFIKYWALLSIFVVFVLLYLQAY